MLLFGCQVAIAQQIASDTIRWNTVELTDLNTNVIVANEVYFITKGNQEVQWVQNNGQAKVDFIVTNSTGQWPNLAVAGEITFQISVGNAAGSIKFSRTPTNVVHVEIHLRGTTSNIDLRYKINGYSKL